MKIIKWETVGQKLVKFKMTDFGLCKSRTKSTVFCGIYHKTQCFSNYLQNHIATRGHSHSMAHFWLCRYVVAAGILAFEI
jgi:hypothetical protein